MTRDALESWRELTGDLSSRMAELLREDEWKDLPPDIAKKLVKAANNFADLTTEIKEACLMSGVNIFHDMDDDIEHLDF